MAQTNLNKKTSEFIVTLSADKGDWKTAQENAFKELAKNIVLKGFRKGQVPLVLAKKNIPTAEIFHEGLKKQLDVLVKISANELPKDIVVLDSPTYRVEKISETDLEVSFIYPIYPEISLEGYKGLEIKCEEEKLDSKLVDDEINKVKESLALLTTKDGKIEKNDIVFFDFEGFIDGKPFDGGKSDNYELIIGSNSFIPGFEDQMIGLKKGEEKDLNLSFPKDYHAENLKGKDVVFKVKINDIKAKVAQELDETAIKSLNIPGVKNELELRNYFSDIFSQENTRKARMAFLSDAFKILKSKVEINIPQSLVAKEMQNQHKHFESEIAKQGLNEEKYLKALGITKEQLHSQFKQASESRLKDSLIFAEVAKLEKIELIDEDYEKEYVKLAKVYGQSEDNIKQMISKTQMQIPMLNDRVLDFLINNRKK